MKRMIVVLSAILLGIVMSRFSYAAELETDSRFSETKIEENWSKSTAARIADGNSLSGNQMGGAGWKSHLTMGELRFKQGMVTQNPGPSLQKQPLMRHNSLSAGMFPTGGRSVSLTNTLRLKDSVKFSGIPKFAFSESDTDDIDAPPSSFNGQANKVGQWYYSFMMKILREHTMLKDDFSFASLQSSM